MDLKTTALTKIEDTIDALDDLLAQALPKNDKKHRDEIFDILSLVKYRSEQYINEYGVTEEFEQECSQ